MSVRLRLIGGSEWVWEECVIMEFGWMEVWEMEMEIGRGRTNLERDNRRWEMGEVSSRREGTEGREEER